MAPLSPQPPQSRKWIALGMPLLTAMFIETFGGAGIFPDSVAASLVQGLALAGIATAYYLIATTEPHMRVAHSILGACAVLELCHQCGAPLWTILKIAALTLAPPLYLALVLQHHLALVLGLA